MVVLLPVPGGPCMKVNPCFLIDDLIAMYCDGLNLSFNLRSSLLDI
jgi:hypothetical protein